MSGSTFGPAATQKVTKDGSLETNALTMPAVPRQYVVLWGTGLGAFRDRDVSITIAGKIVTPTYAGPAPGLPGVDQINFQVPDESPSSCYVPLTVTAGGRSSNVTAISVDRSTGACVHPLGLFGDEERKLDRGDSILAGSLSFNAAVYSPNLNAISYTRQENFSAMFLLQDAAGIYAMCRSVPVSAGCALQDALGPIAILAAGTAPSIGGQSMSLTDPANLRYDVPFQFDYSLTLAMPAPASSESKLPPPAFVPGWWTIAAPGGSGIKAFSQRYLLPAEIRWTNRDSLASFGRDSDLTIIRDPQDSQLGDQMIAALLTPGAQYISCSADAVTVQIVIPQALLQQIGPTAPSPGMLTLILQRPQPTVFRMELVSGGSAPAIINFFYTDSLRPIVH